MKCRKFVWVFIFALISGGAGANAQSGLGQTLRYCSEASPSVFNCHIATDGASLVSTCRTVFNSLVERVPGTQTLALRLASKWTRSKDGLRYRFDLRKDVRFHSNFGFKPTRNFNADDVLFTFERMLNKEHPYHRVGRGVFPNFFALGLDKNIKEVKKLDDHSVEFVLREPQNNFMAYISGPFSTVLSAEYAKYLLDRGTPEKIDFEPVGTGPFIFKSYEKDQATRFRRNPEYFLGPAALENLVVQIVTDPSVRTQKLRAGECDIAHLPPFEELDALKADSRINYLEAPSSNSAYLVFNTKKAPLNDARVRRAISLAMNVDSYVKAVYAGRGDRAKTLLPPVFAVTPGKAAINRYAPEEAKRLLAAAGFKDGLKLNLWALPVSRHYNPNGKRMAELMQADLKKVGIEISIQSYDWPTYLAKLKEGNEHDLAQLGWGGDVLDPESFLAPTFSCAASNGGFGASKWCDEKFEQALRKGRVALMDKAAKAAYLQALTRFAEEIPATPIAHAYLVSASLKRVKNFRINPSGGVDFYPISLEE